MHACLKRPPRVGCSRSWAGLQCAGPRGRQDPGRRGEHLGESTFQHLASQSQGQVGGEHGCRPVLRAEDQRERGIKRRPRRRESSVWAFRVQAGKEGFPAASTEAKEWEQESGPWPWRRASEGCGNPPRMKRTFPQRCAWGGVSEPEWGEAHTHMGLAQEG